MDPDTPSAEQGMTPISRTFHAGEWYVLSSSHETCVATLRQRLSAAELQLATTHALEKSARLELADAERERDQFEGDMHAIAEDYKNAHESLTAAQAEIQRLKEELKIVVGICSSDTLPRKEQS